MDPRRLAAASFAVLVLALALAQTGAPTVARNAQATVTPTRSPPAGTWRAVHSPKLSPLWPGDPPKLNGVHGIRDDYGRPLAWAVGDDGALAHYDGQRWLLDQSLDERATAPRVYHFRDVYVCAADDVWVVGIVSGDKYCDGCGVVAHYDGEHWRVLDKGEFGVVGRVAPLNAIDMMQSPDGTWYGWAVGDDADFDNIKAIILRYTGERWDLWLGPNNIAKHLYDVKIVSPREAWAVGQDGSESWYMEDDRGVGSWPRLGHSGVDTLYAVDLADQLEGWDGGARGRMNHYEGGCHDETLETQCWFNNAALPMRDANGQVLPIEIHDIDVVSRTEGWLVANAYVRTSVIAYLDGSVWRTVKVADDPGVSLNALHMWDAQYGWAVGDDGTILQYVDETAPTPTATPTATATQVPTATDTATLTPLPVPTTQVPTEQAPTPVTGPTETTTPPPSPTASATTTSSPEPTSTDVPAHNAYLPELMRGR